MTDQSVTNSLDDLKQRLIILRAARLRLAAEVGEMTNENRDPLPDNDAIARRAHELFEARGGEHGHDADDWLQAEHELSNRSAKESDPDYPVTVETNNQGDKVVTGADQSTTQDQRGAA
jgi:hypothetical protein